MSILLKKIIGREGERIGFHQISHFPKDPCLENIFFWESRCTPGAKGEHSLHQERQGEKWKLRGFAQGQISPKWRAGGASPTALWWHQHISHPRRDPETGQRLLMLPGIFLHMLAPPPWCKMLLYYMLEKMGWSEGDPHTKTWFTANWGERSDSQPWKPHIGPRCDLCTAMMWI